MNLRTFLAGVALAALAVGTAAVIDTKDVTPTKPADVQAEVKGEEKLARSDDGGIAYLRPVQQKDGGTGVVIVTTPSCARKPIGDKTCTRVDGGDPGELNRYDSTQLAGVGCQPVACSVFAGEDADAEESERVTESKGGGK